MPITIDRLEADLPLLDVRTPPETSVLLVVGDLDAGAAGALDAALREAERDARPVVLELSGVRFADSTGLLPIAEAQRRSRRNAWPPLEIRTISAGVRRVYAALGVDWSPRFDLVAWDAAEQDGLRLWQSLN